MSRYRETWTRLNSLYEAFPLDLETLDLDAFAETMDRVSFRGDFDESSTTIDKLKSTSVDILSSEELRALLLQFEVMAVDYDEVERYVIFFQREHF